MASRWRWALVVVGLAALMAACRGPAQDPLGSLDDVARELPQKLAGWRGEEPVRFDPESIYSYIDGHAEVYLAYGMQGCLARRYLGPATEPAIVVDVFELATTDDAYGVFTYDRDGSEVDVGHDALLRHGWLSFWQGRFFVSVYAEAETEAAGQAVVALGRAVADAIPAAGAVPAIVGLLPADGLDPRSVRFLRHHLVLNTHHWVSSDNVLALGPRVAAALGRYRFGDAVGDLLVVRYPDAAAATAAFEGFDAAFLGGGGTGRPAADADGAWWAAERAGAIMAVVLGASSSELAEQVLAAARPTGGDR